LAFCVDEGDIYYTNAEDGKNLWSMDASGKNKRKLNSEYTTNPNFDDDISIIPLKATCRAEERTLCPVF